MNALDERPAALAPDQALARREEVLEICFWFRGEGFGDTFEPKSLKTFLPYPEAEIFDLLQALTRQGQFDLQPSGSYTFTPGGLKLAARLFADGFTDFQQAAHGECADGCCDDDDHSRCAHA